MSPGDLVLLKTDAHSSIAGQVGVILYELKGLNYEKQSFRSYAVLVRGEKSHFNDYELELLTDMS